MRPMPGPRWAAWIARRLLSPHDAERLLADLDEEFLEFQRPRRTRWSAELWYGRQVVLSIRALRRRAGRRRRPSDAARASGGLAESLYQDLRYALRNLGRTPTFTIAAVTTLGLGIGATTAIFSVVDAVLLAELPYGGADRILRAWSHADDGDIRDFSFRVAEIEALSTLDGAFEAVGAEFPMSSTVLLPDQGPRQVEGRMVSPDFFRVFGTRLAAGRMFTAAEIADGEAPVAVVSHRFWDQVLGGDPAAVGRSIDLSGTPFTVIGVLPEGYRHISGDAVEVFAPYTLGTSGWVGRWLSLYLRVRREVSASRAESELNAVLRSVGEEDRRSAGWNATVEDLHSMVVGDVRPAVWATFATVGLVLLIAVVNVANLTLARAGSRRGEIAVRRAVGAARGRLVRQLLVESLVLALIGGAAGVSVAMVGLRTLVAIAPPSIPRLVDARIDLSVLGFALILTVGTAVVFGLLPALRLSRSGVSGQLRLRSRGATGRRVFGGLLGGLVVGEVALALTLLVGAGLMVRSVRALSNEELGFDRSNALTFRVEAPAGAWPDDAGVIAFFGQLSEGLKGLPGVTAVGAGSDLPVSGQGAVATVNSEERVQAGLLEGVTTLQRRATIGFFEAMGTPVLSGRGFESVDGPEAEPSTIISASLASALFGDAPAVGQRIGWGNSPEDEWMRVVGVVGDVRYRDAALVDDPQIYEPHRQSAVRAMAMVVRTTGDPLDLIGAARGLLNDIDPSVAMSDVATLGTLVDRTLAPHRFTMTLFALFAGVALLLTLAGIYGVLAFVVGRRRREIGVRMALGARAADVTGMVVRQGMALVGMGLTLGLLVSFVASRLLESLIYGVATSDPVTYVAVALVLAGTGLAACLVPAVESARTLPMSVLGAE